MGAGNQGNYPENTKVIDDLMREEYHITRHFDPFLIQYRYPICCY